MLHYETLQSDTNLPWVIFIHGAGGSTRTWLLQQEAFRPYFNVLLIDLRDHGLSKDIKPCYNTYSFQIISDDIRQVMDHLQIEKAHFVTLSFGSVLVQDFTQRFPERVDKLVLAGAIFKANAMIRTFVHSARFVNYFLPYRHMYALFSYLLMPRKRNQKARKAYLKQARKIRKHEYLKWLGLYDTFFKLLSQFSSSEMSKSVLVVMGADDFVFLRAARQYITCHQNARLSVLQNVGHICNIESPEPFNTLAVDHLRN